MINDVEYQPHHIAPHVVMGTGKSGPSSERYNARIASLVEKGLWEKDSSQYNLILLPTDASVASARGLARHKNPSHLAYSDWYNKTAGDLARTTEVVPLIRTVLRLS